jgi:serine protease Do
MPHLKPFAVVLLCLFVLGAAASPGVWAETRVPVSQAEVKLSFAPLVKAAAPAVVNIYARKIVRRQVVSPLFQDPFFRRFFGDRIPHGMPQEQVENSLGSGVLVRADGIVVTNNHVVAGADEITVALNDRREFDVEVLGTDESTDLAVLRLKGAPTDLPTIPFGDSDALEVGDMVLAIGNPFGVGQTVTSGIVSALARTTVGIADFRSFIQTDAAINPGNSGGALVTLDGTLAGVNTAIYSRDGGNVGIGFAIPSDMVQAVVRGIVDGGKLVRPWLGADGQPVGGDIADSLGLDRPGGVLVNRLVAQAPAARAGLRIGDVVVAVNGRDVLDVQGLRYRIATLAVGDTARLTVVRDGAVRDVDVVLEAPPDDPPRDQTAITGRNPLNGTTVANLNPALSEETGIPYAADSVVVLAVAPDGYAARLGLRPGDILRSINGAAVARVADLRGLLEGGPRPGWMIQVERGGRMLNFRVG